MFKNKLENLEKGLIVISYLIFTIGLAISIVLMYILYQHTSLVTESDAINNELTGVIGDFFGGVVGTLFALVSVLLFYLAFQHQKRELKSTNEAFSRQQFENTFFNLLRNQDDIRGKVFTVGKKDIEINYDLHQSEWKKVETQFQSFEFFDLVREKMISNVEILERNLSLNLNSSIEESFLKQYGCSIDDIINKPEKKCQVIFKLVYSDYRQSLSHYFRNLYHILKFIKSAEDRDLAKAGTEKELVKSDYKKYANFLQAQLSEVEMFLIFYDALFFRRFKKLVQYYKIVENLYIEDLLYPQQDIKYYQCYESNLDGKKEPIEGLKFKSRSEELKIKPFEELEKD